jgi:hypothetical protein
MSGDGIIYLAEFSALAHVCSYIYMRAVRKVWSYFEYLEKRSRGINVTWQTVRADLTAHP